MNNFLKDFEPIHIENLGYIKLPKYEITEEECKKFKITKDISSEKFLTKLIHNGFIEREKLIPKDKIQEYKDRINEEYKVYKNLHFIDYILLIYSVIQFCKKNNILNSPCRGSCGGSCILFIIGVTSIDPLKHNLLFERFISSSRTEIKEINGEQYLSSASLPDVDIDSDTIFKPLLNKFLEEKFPNKTCKILNLLTLQAKIAIKETGKVLGLKSEEEMTGITSLIESLFGTVNSLEETYEKNEQFKKWADENKKIYETACKLEGLIKNTSVHASGIFIGSEDLGNLIPTQLTSDKHMVTSYDMSMCSLLGIKIDNLGLKNLGAINHCLTTIGKTIHDIDVNDPCIYQYLNNSQNTYGIFQCEEGLGKQTLLKIKPINIDEINLAISMSRPGCYKFVDDYVLNKLNGNYDIHPSLKSILSPTLGIIVYQEQLMKISVVMAKFNPQEANGVRSAVGKKDKEKMMSYKEKFIKQSIENGYTEEFVIKTWQTFEDSGSYLFCASHGCGYGYLTAITTYLKVKYPLQYFLSLLTYSRNEASPIEEISKIHKEMLSFGIKLLPPSLKLSKMDFTIEDNNIRFGLSSIKGISDQTIEKLNNFKREHANKFEMFLCAKEAGLNIGQLSAIIQSGAMQEFNTSARSFLVYEAQLFNLLTNKEKKFLLDTGSKFEYRVVDTLKNLTTLKDEKGKSLIRETRINTIRKKSEKYKEIYNKNKISEDFCNYFYEKRLLGYTYCTTLKDIFCPKYEQNLETINEIKQLPVDTKVKFIGIVDENAKMGTSKNGNKYAKYESISDEMGNVKCMIFSKNLEQTKLINGDKLPKEGETVIIEGIIKQDVVFCNKISSQQNKIYWTLQDLKDDKILD